MKIGELRLQNFGVHKSRTFLLSPGVSLITAANGTGKTTLASALTWLIWGKLIRPLDLERGASVSAAVASDSERQELVRRIATQGELVDFGSVFKNSNKTRAAETLQALFGRWDAWKRTLHVTGRTVAAFSTGTPKDKLDHLVAITGADKFDVALDKQRIEEKNALARSTETDTKYRNASAILVREEMALSEISSCITFVKEGVDSADVEQKYSECDARIVRCAKYSAELEQKAAVLSRLSSTFDNAQRRAVADAQSSSVSVCPTCKGPVRTQQDQELLLRAAEYAALRDIARKENQDVLELRNRVTQKLSTLYMTRSSLFTVLNESRMRADVLNDIETRTYRAYCNVVSRTLEVQQCAVEHTAAVADSEKIVLARSVLLRARSRYLRRYAVAIQSSANYYLGQIGSSIRVLLKYEQDKLVVQTESGYEYASLSEGEKRRLDLCLILAMSQVAAETGTVPASAPLIIDEAFDTLDADGVAALIYLACVVAQRRQVLLISHAEPDVPKGVDVWHIKL